MLKTRKIAKDYDWGTSVGVYKHNAYTGTFRVHITTDKITKEVDHEEYYMADFTLNTDCEDEILCDHLEFDGVILAFNLNVFKLQDYSKYFPEDFKDYWDTFYRYDRYKLLDYIRKIILEKIVSYDREYSLQEDIVDDDNYLQIIIPGKRIDDTDIKELTLEILECIRDSFENLNAHVTRMFGSYIFMLNMEDKLRALFATDVPINYCPLMVKLLSEVGGDRALELLNTIREGGPSNKLMLDLINDVVIDGGYFDTSRPLNSCEANVLFGASETMSSAFNTGMIDASVIVSNNLGTIITTNGSNTQGAVKRMTGLFYTSPSKELVNTAIDAGIIPVFPYTAEIDQLEGVKKAIEMGYKNIAVSVAAGDNYLHEELKRLEEVYGVTIYKFGLCSTGISEEVAKTMRDNADVIWSCASLNVKKYIEPASIAQVGVKIPVYIMTERGWNIVNNHLHEMNRANNNFEPSLASGDDRPVFVNDAGMIRELKKRDIKKCSDCPKPCV